MKVSRLNGFLLLFLVCYFSINVKAQYSSNLDVLSVRKVVTAVANWQIKAYPDMDKQRYWKSEGDLTWENGVFLGALASWAETAKDTAMIRWYENIAAKNYYSTNKKKNCIYFGDDFPVCMMYFEMYNKKRNSKIIASTRARMDYIINYPAQTELNFKTPNATDRWSWADALYMAPPSFAAMSKYTGDMKYIDFMDNEYWASYDYLYSKTDSLFFRDSNYFTKLEKNGKMVFWGRGNGWVVGGLCQILENMPYSYPSRKRYENLLLSMLTKLVKIQDINGYWHASLLDPESYPSPETSSTGFITYSIMWGINNGVLDKKTFMPYVVKGWTGIVNAVHDNGMLGWVQPIGGDPQKVTKDMTETYGAAAVMLTGREILKYLRDTTQQVN